MVDIARLISDNVVYILVGCIVIVGLVVSYFVWKRERMRLMPKTSKIPKIDAELMKTNLPTKTGVVTKGRLDNALKATQKETKAREKEDDVGMRRRPVRRAARRRPVRRTARRTTRTRKTTQRRR